MHVYTAHAKHKLLVAGLLLGLFALPFVVAWQRGVTFYDQAVLAGGAVIGKHDLPTSSRTTTPSANNAGQIIGTAGGDFIGDMTQ